MNNLNSIAIAGIHTGIGKTIASAVIAEAIGADYWKPVQAGLEERDTHTVRELISNGVKRVHGEAILLSRPISPHAAAAVDGIDIDYKTFEWPQTDKTLLVETAGGILSPISANGTMADFITHYNMPAILVSQNYLGSINHTLMSIEVLRSRDIKLLGIVMCGPENPSSEAFIEQYGKVPVIAHIPHFERLDSGAVSECAVKINAKLFGLQNETVRYDEESLNLLRDISNKYFSGKMDGYSVESSMKQIREQIKKRGTE
jgi:dethiobiotin synthetase